jgi:hypothetical protein
MSNADTSHLVALQTRLSHERGYLAAAKKDSEKALRAVWIKQIEKELADEMTRLGMSAELPEMTDDELFAALKA